MKRFFVLLLVVMAVTTLAAPLNPFLVLAQVDDALSRSDPTIAQQINNNYRSAFLRLYPEVSVSRSSHERWAAIMSCFPQEMTQGITLIFVQGANTTRIGNEIFAGNGLLGDPESDVRIYLAEAIATGYHGPVLEYLIEHRFAADDIPLLRRALKSRIDKRAVALLGGPDSLIKVLQRQLNNAIIPVKEGEFRIQELQKLKMRGAEIAGTR